MRFGQYLIKRVVLMVAVLFGASILSFVLVRVAPGDPVRMLLPPEASHEDVVRVGEQLGLNRPYHEQYLRYISQILKGDFGFSHHTGKPVLAEFQLRLPATIELAVLSLALATLLGIGLGVLSALHQNRFIDHAVRIFSIGGVSAPTFWIGLLAIFFFYSKLGWAPAPTGRLDMMTESIEWKTGFLLIDTLMVGNIDQFLEALAHLVLPTCVLALSFLAMICRLTRAGMLEVLHQDYIRFAACCGIERWRIIWHYALKNGIRPVLTMLGLFFAQLLGGVVFIEIVFNWPGIGRYAVESIAHLDYAPIQGFIIFMAVVYVLMNLIVDVVYMLIDPRVQY